MHLIVFSVKKQIITHESCRPLIAESRGHVYARFMFDEEWADLSITVTFQHSALDKPVSVILTENPIEIPSDVLLAGHLSISLLGLDDQGRIRIPTATMTKPIKVYRAGAFVGISPDQAVPELWEQVLSVIGQVSNLDTENKQSLVAAINEVFAKIGSSSGGNGAGENGATFIPSVSENGVISWTNDKGLPNPNPVKITPARGTDYWTDADKAEIKSYVDEAILGGAW